MKRDKVYSAITIFLRGGALRAEHKLQLVFGFLILKNLLTNKRYFHGAFFI